jgi:hypothetical protein
MTRRFALALVAIAGLALVTSPILLAHEGHPHKMMGTVTMAAPDHLMMKMTDGKDATVQITSETKITKAKKPMKVEDLTPGLRVVVTAVTVKTVMKAKSIEIGTAPITR